MSDLDGESGQRVRERPNFGSGERSEFFPKEHELFLYVSSWKDSARVGNENWRDRT